jgi:hypothetical protein
LGSIKLVQSQKFHSIFAIFPLVKGENLTAVGKPVPIASTFIKKLNQRSPSPNGVLSNQSSHNETTTLLLSSTIHTGFFFQSQSTS